MAFRTLSIYDEHTPWNAVICLWRYVKHRLMRLQHGDCVSHNSFMNLFTSVAAYYEAWGCIRSWYGLKKKAAIQSGHNADKGANSGWKHPEEISISLYIYFFFYFKGKLRNWSIANWTMDLILLKVCAF